MLPWNPSDHPSTIVLWSFGGPSIGPPSYRETPVCQTADVILHTGETFVEILLNQTEIRLYFQFSDSFGTASGRVRLLFKINRYMVNTI